MKHSDFKMGMEFTTSNGSKIWRVTDLGTRTIVAIRIDDFVVGGTAGKREITSEPEGWFDGPPYAVAEHVFDENDVVGCEVIYEKDHHPFCNRGNHWGPRKDCRWCDDYYENYPLTKGESSEGLILRYFPGVTVIK